MVVSSVRPSGPSGTYCPHAGKAGIGTSTTAISGGSGTRASTDPTTTSPGLPKDKEEWHSVNRQVIVWPIHACG